MTRINLPALLTKSIGLIMAALFSMSLFAAIDVYDFDSPQQEAQYRGLIEELRCPKCQNQNLAASDAPIAQDLKQKTYDLVKEGRSDSEIRDYMQERYGDFISYKPPVRPSTWILWFFPPLLLIALIAGWFWRTHKRQSLLKLQQNHQTEALTASEQAELDRMLSGQNDAQNLQARKQARNQAGSQTDRTENRTKDNL